MAGARTPIPVETRSQCPKNEWGNECNSVRKILDLKLKLADFLGRRDPGPSPPPVTDMALSRSAFPGGCFRRPSLWFHHSAFFPASLAPGPGWARAAQDGRLRGSGVGWGEGKGFASLSCLFPGQGREARPDCSGNPCSAPRRRKLLGLCQHTLSAVGTLRCPLEGLSSASRWPQFPIPQLSFTLGPEALPSGLPAKEETFRYRIVTVDPFCIWERGWWWCRDESRSNYFTAFSCWGSPHPPIFRYGWG